MVILLASAGCIEQRDPPEKGEFTITMETYVVMYAYEGLAGDLHGPHAEVETELHHEHPEYSWSIEGMEHHEGSDVHIDAGDIDLRKVTYHLEYYEHWANMSMVLATVPEALGTYVVVAELPPEDHGDAVNDTELEIEPVGDLAAIVNASMGRVMEPRNEWSRDGLTFNVSLAEDAEASVTYVAGYHIGTGTNVVRYERAFVIHPGLHHNITFLSGSEINISVANTTTPDTPFWEGTYEELPSSYVAHPGHLEWEGEVGEVEEAPGPGAVITLTALFVAVVVMVRRRQSD